ncbi:MAG: hypothetical protein C5B49_09585 [Bdellovibrio sp.]|nr:MAG: hypothetical protein C5B49_09585 [Bdellovibrio sp.]
MGPSRPLIAILIACPLPFGSQSLAEPLEGVKRAAADLVCKAQADANSPRYGYGIHEGSSAYSHGLALLRAVHMTYRGRIEADKKLADRLLACVSQAGTHDESCQQDLDKIRRGVHEARINLALVSNQIGDREVDSNLNGWRDMLRLDKLGNYRPQRLQPLSNEERKEATEILANYIQQIKDKSDQLVASGKYTPEEAKVFEDSALLFVRSSRVGSKDEKMGQEGLHLKDLSKPKLPAGSYQSLVSGSLLLGHLGFPSPSDLQIREALEAIGSYRGQILKHQSRIGDKLKRGVIDDDVLSLLDHGELVGNYLHNHPDACVPARELRNIMVNRGYVHTAENILIGLGASALVIWAAPAWAPLTVAGLGFGFTLPSWADFDFDWRSFRFHNFAGTPKEKLPSLGLVESISNSGDELDRASADQIIAAYSTAITPVLATSAGGVMRALPQVKLSGIVEKALEFSKQLKIP